MTTPMAPDWVTPQTWDVGDDIDLDNWTSRWYNQMSLMLRRPLTVVRRTTLQTVAAGINYTNNITFDTIDQDDDGMVSAGVPTDTLYVQRAGVHNIFISVPFVGNAQTANPAVFGIKCQVNWGTPSGTTIRARESRSLATTGTDCCRSIDTSVFLNEGDFIQVSLWNATAFSANIQPYYNAPRLAVMWFSPQS